MRLALALALVLAAAPAGGWTFYYHLFGDWRLVCWRSAADSVDARCDLSAPPDEIAAGTRNVLHVAEPAPDTFRVWIEIRDRPEPGVPAFVRIGAFPVHQAMPADGIAAWQGLEALRMVGEMRAAPKLVFRVETAPDGLPRDTPVTLAPFRNALAAYREAIRRNGILARPRPRNPL
jgi:hypothetical protein